jgi:hypothetical protein
VFVSRIKFTRCYHSNAGGMDTCTVTLEAYVTGLREFIHVIGMSAVKPGFTSTTLTDRRCNYNSNG